MAVSDSKVTARFRRQLAAVSDDLALAPPAPTVTESIARRRSRRTRLEPANQSAMVFTERQGVLVLEERRPRRRGVGLRRRAARTVALGGEVVEVVPFRLLPASAVGAALAKLDRKLTLDDTGDSERPDKPEYGLHRLRKNGKLDPITRAPATGPLLLLVHGTFSNTSSLLEELDQTDHGRAFLRKAMRRYEAVLTFDHPTLSATPYLNASELALAMGHVDADVDIICHSRGGLVTRWWLEALDRGDPARRRVVFVGAPLAGTSLAAPPKIRSALSLFANISRALGTATAAVPFLTAAAGIFQIVSSVTSLAAKTPLVDAAVALIPGLEAQSREGENLELLGMRRYQGALDRRYFAVQSNFEPQKHGWAFWKYFRKLPQRLADIAVDPLFDGPNDMVVDTFSMADLDDLRRIPAEQIHDFGKNGVVHHCNYFRQKATLEKINEWLM